MTIETRLDTPMFINERVSEKDGTPGVSFVNWITQSQQQINDVFAQLNRVESGEFTTVAGSATQTIPVTDASASDSAMVTVHTFGATPRSVLGAVAGTGNITVTMSGDPSNDHVLTWQLIKR